MNDDLQAILADNRSACAVFAAALGAVPSARWSESRAPGKWSPGQVAEHIAISFELADRVVRGLPLKSALPRLMRWMLRQFYVNPILRSNAMKPGKTVPQFQPSATPAFAPTMKRLDAAVLSFTAACEEAARGGRTVVEHPAFGTLPLLDYARLQVIHVRHHLTQVPK
jgi:hypothetical protein